MGLQERFERHIESSGLLAGAKRVLVALSGGGDSTALLALLAPWAPRSGVELEAVHVAHGLRGEAGERDAQASRALAARLGVPFTLVRVGVSRDRGLEAGARAARYAALLEAAGERGAGTLVATGHTRDDEAETVLLNLERRAGRARGGIRARRADGVVRPLLPFSRAELRELLSLRELPHSEDETNADERRARNRIRRRVLPALEESSPGAAERLARAGRALDARTAALDRELDAALAAAGARGTGPFPRSLLAALGPEHNARLLLRAASPRSPGRAQVDRVLSRLARGETFEEAFAGRRLRAGPRVVRLV
ncbi:MAG TPA: tRNA lysidine(34) synthetase TilS [Thermoanaerobaculia bacterium]|nr:tRNA lysidine(34) synthetase TilS [Thermoanaerobaculia bacterium]